jgi:hypothetical protein
MKYLEEWVDSSSYHPKGRGLNTSGSFPFCRLAQAGFSPLANKDELRAESTVIEKMRSSGSLTTNEQSANWEENHYRQENSCNIHRAVFCSIRSGGIGIFKQNVSPGPTQPRGVISRPVSACGNGVMEMGSGLVLLYLLMLLPDNLAHGCIMKSGMPCDFRKGIAEIIFEMWLFGARASNRQ